MYPYSPILLPSTPFAAAAAVPAAPTPMRAQNVCTTCSCAAVTSPMPGISLLEPPTPLPRVFSVFLSPFRQTVKTLLHFNLIVLGTKYLDSHPESHV